MNFERWRPWLRALFLSGRLLGGRRAESWPVFKRLAYAAASPLIPFLRLTRARRAVRRAEFPRLVRWRLYPVMGVGLLADGLGQFLGYLFGKGDARAFSLKFEFHRERYLKQA
jgi:hypothetical protein